MEEIGDIEKELEKQFKKKLPFDVRYINNIDAVFCVPPIPKLRSESRREWQRKLNSMLKLRGLGDHEIEAIESTKYTIFVPIAYKNQPAKLCGCLYEEMGESLAHSLGVVNKITQHGIGLAFSFKGLLQRANEGRISLEEAVDHIELQLKKHKNPLAYITKYHNALNVIRRFNPNLEFRDRDPDELINELDKSIKYILTASERFKDDLRRIRSKAKSFFKRLNARL